jgi:hypothetical protein
MMSQFLTLLGVPKVPRARKKGIITYVATRWRHVILRSAATKNLQAVGQNRLNNAEILRSYLAQNDIIGVGSNLRYNKTNS